MAKNLLNRGRLPLSAPGSLLGVSAETRVDKDRFFVRSLHRFADPRDLVGIGLADRPNPASVELRPDLLTLGWPGASIEVAFSGRDSLRLRAKGGVGELVISPPDAAVDGTGGNQVLVTHPSGSPVLRVSSIHGRMELRERHIRFGTGASGGEVCIEEINGDPDPGEAFEFHVQARAHEFGRWLGRFEEHHPDAPAGALVEAAYLFWCCQAGPRGSLKRRAVLMSKNWMTGIWSWDNCFNAVALADIDPELAWDQFCFFFDWQAEDGRLPDLITASGVDWGMTKPPVYGWALSKLRARDEFFNTADRLRKVYEPMAHQVRFWLEIRDSDGDGLPEYHHGCDSGWDNGTVFLQNTPTASPDLAAWLILQLEELAHIAPIVGRAGEAGHWLEQADRISAAMQLHCWNGTRWQGIQAGCHEPAKKGDCLLPWLAGIAGHRFSKAQQQSVIDAIGSKGRFLTPYGVATEAVNSPLYESDGYWRGPIWGPSTIMAVDACRACGDHELAAEIARRFCSMAPAFGFAENHDALTGHGLRDPAYTWTAAAWLMLDR